MHNLSSLMLMCLRLYVLSLPFTYALSFWDGRLSITVLLSCYLGFLLSFRLISHHLIIPRLGAVYFMFFAFLFFLPLGSLFANTFSSTTFNHLLAYLVSIIGLGFIPMLAVANIQESGWAAVLLRDLMWTARLAATVAVVQFICSNFFGQFFEDYIYYPDTIEARSMFMGLFYRSRGFAAEPGHYAFTLEFLAPLLFYGHSLVRNKSIYVIVADFLLILLAFFCIGSPLGLLVFGAGFLLAFLFFPSRHNIVLLCCGLFALAVAFSLMDIVSNQVNQSNWLDLLSSLFIDKLSSTSAIDRAERIDIGFRLIEDAAPLQMLFGYGPAVYESQKLGDQTIMQFYLLLLLEGGVVGMILFVGGFICLTAYAIKQLGSGRFFYFWAFISLLLHYFFISNYYYPMIWFLFPLLLIIQAVDKQVTS